MTRWFPVLAVALAVSGCGYALAGRANTLSPSIRRIGVPAFQNLSTTPDLDRTFTEAVRVELQSKGKFTVVSDTVGVDAVLSGAIRSVTQEPTAFTDRQGSKYTVTVTARAEFKEVKDSKIIWSRESLRVTDDYDVAAGGAVTDLSTLFAQNTNSLDRLAKAFAQQLVRAILDNF